MRFWLILLALGAGWGLTQPFSKIAVSGDYQSFGIIFWQSAIGVVMLSVVSLIRRKGLPMGAAHLRVYAVIALVGTVVPNAFSYISYKQLDAGIMSIVIATVPIFAFPIALAMGNERMRLLRLVGLFLGFAGVLFLILPGQEAIGQVSVIYILIALIAPALYGFEGNWVARFGTAGLDPLQVIFGSSLVGLVVSAPLALALGQWISPNYPPSNPDWAVLASSSIHVVVYSSDVWLIAAAGPVFAVQVSYIVTLSGVIWARLILGESYSPWVWAALALVLAGVFLVQPKPKLALVPEPVDGQD
jgi:drug/metabolite transporter (DMT)-like permease